MLELIDGEDKWDVGENKINAAITKVNELDEDLTSFSESSAIIGLHSTVGLSSTYGVIKATRSGNLIFYDVYVSGSTTSSNGWSWTINLPAGFFASSYSGMTTQAGQPTFGTVVDSHSFNTFSGIHGLSVIDNRLVISTGADGAIGTGRFVKAFGTIIGYV